MDVSPSTSERFPWRLFLVPTCTASILSTLAIFPIASDMMGAILSKVELPHIPLALLVLVGVVQNLVLLALIVWLGLRLSRRLGLRAPLLESWLYGKTEAKERLGPALTSGLFTGVAVGLVLVIALFVLVARLPNLPFVVAARLPVWKRFLACFYGGVYEEMLTRLFLLALVAWLAK